MLGELHDEIDRAVLRAYGWDDLIDPLVGKPGATCPSPHKSADQEAAEQTLLSRLVALNQTRRAEEQQGTVRWLRPDYQLPKLRHKLPQGTQLETPGLEPVTAESQPKWPSDDLQQIRVVHQVLERADSPVTPETVARAFAGKLSAKRKQRVDEVLQTLTATGAARTPEGDPTQRLCAKGRVRKLQEPVTQREANSYTTLKNGALNLGDIQIQNWNIRGAGNRLRASF
ncbi:MAG: hypothetical protein U5L06_03635 [Rhodovibrio sp.]|nr:hypothetical protein [Rhodovibrio sp.]